MPPTTTSINPTIQNNHDDWNVKSIDARKMRELPNDGMIEVDWANRTQMRWRMHEQLLLVSRPFPCTWMRSARPSSSEKRKSDELTKNGLVMLGMNGLCDSEPKRTL
jgi:hypothetical protein